MDVVLLLEKLRKIKLDVSDITKVLDDIVLDLAEESRNKSVPNFDRPIKDLGLSPELTRKLELHPDMFPSAGSVLAKTEHEWKYHTRLFGKYWFGRLKNELAAKGLRMGMTLEEIAAAKF